MSYALAKLMGEASAKKPTFVHENKRIADLPVCTYEAVDLTDLFKKPSGAMRLFPLQNKALQACKDANGGVLLLGCGVGKTLISFLLAPQMGKTRPLLLVPASLRDKTFVEAKKYAEHFDFPMPEVLNYEALSRATGLTKLADYAPDLIICDEAHMLKDLSSTRTGRLGRYLLENEACSLVVMSGTLFNKSLADFAHLSDWALAENSPVPRNARDVDAWDALLVGAADEYIAALFKPMYEFGQSRSAREAIFKRLSASKGVVLTTDEAVPSSLQISIRKCEVPKELRTIINEALAGDSPMADLLESFGLESIESIEACQHLWENPDSFMLHALSQLMSGLLYFWEWEGNEPDTEWLTARKAWRKAVNSILEMDFDGIDSPQLVFDNFLELPQQVVEMCGEAYELWLANKDKAQPPRGVAWISDYLVDDIEEWYHAQKEPVLIWVDSIALGERLSDRLSIPYHGGGVEFDTNVARSAVVSIASHGTGKNLQMWSNNLVVAAMSSPHIWEQLLARTHRNGQLADTVRFTVYGHSIFGSSFNKALYLSRVISDTTGQTQRLCYADKVKG